MVVCIFSFNRGRFLQHCVESVERCAPGWTICVFDDGSTDPLTLEVLAGLAGKHRVISAEGHGDGGRGGLHGNMQRALEIFRDEDLMLCLQDDMQLVRVVTPDDERFLHRFFDDDPSAGFLHPCFLKGSNRKRDQRTVRFSGARGVYVRESTGQGSGVHYSDVMITSPRRLTARGWRFADTEAANDAQAARLFGAMAIMFAPFAMWLPEVPAYRGKRKTVALRIAERLRRCDFHPFHDLTAAQAAQLADRPASVLPVAEDMLTNVHPGLARPWAYQPFHGRRWLRALNSLELALAGR